MSAPSASPATDVVRPRPRPFWSDVRFLLGIVLVIASIAGVWLVVAAARQTVPVFAAARTIVVGSTVGADDLRVVEVALGAVADTYAAPGVLQPGAVATRTIAPGELVPVAALGEADQVRTTTIMIRSATDVPRVVTTGTLVELWAAAPLERGQYDTPRILVPGATVVAVTRDDGMMGSAGAALELVIDRADVAAALAAVADGSSLSVVPVNGAAQ